MTAEEYIAAQKELSEKYENDKKMLARQYAFSNNPHKEGDIITDGDTTIKIEKIKWTWGFSPALPFCSYYGRIYTKKGIPSKNGKSTTIYQNNIQ